MEIVKEGDLYTAQAWYEQKLFVGASEIRAEAMDRCFKKLIDYKNKTREVVVVDLDNSTTHLNGELNIESEHFSPTKNIDTQDLPNNI